MDEQKPHQPTVADYLVAAYSALGIGLMVGMLLGMAVSPTVAAFIGPLGAILAALLGLNDSHFNLTKGIRIGTFGLATILGVAIGVSIRTHDLFSPSLEALKQEYQEIGFSDEEVLEILKQRRFGMFSDIEVIDKNPNTPAGQILASNGYGASVLFSKEISLTGCDEVTTAFDQDLPVDNLLENFRLAGGSWEDLAEASMELNDGEDRKSVLLVTRNALCESPRLALSSQECSDIRIAIGGDSDNLLGKWGHGPLENLEARIVESVSEKARKQAYKVALGHVASFCLAPDE